MTTKARFNAHSKCWGVNLLNVDWLETVDDLENDEYFVLFVMKNGTERCWWCRDKTERNNEWNRVYALWETLHLS